MTRRINVNRKSKKKHQPLGQLDIKKAAPDPESGDKNYYQETPVLDKQAGQEGCLPVAVILKILAGELDAGGQEGTLCKAAVRLAEVGGIIDNCRASWDAEQENAAGQSSVLFDRRQCLELIRYHQDKGNNEAMKKEKDKLGIFEGRLLLGQSPPLKVTDEDLEKLEEFIRENGF